MGAELTTGRLRLVPMTRADIADHVELDGDPEVMRFITGGRASTQSDVEQRFVVAGSHTWTARTVSDGRFVGWLSLRPTSKADVELGYRLRRDAWGRGYAVEGARELVDHGLADPALARVWAQTMTVNERSRRVLERLGFRLVRTFFEEWDDEIPGGELGDVEYELLRADWPGTG